MLLPDPRTLFPQGNPGALTNGLGRLDFKGIAPHGIHANSNLQPQDQQPGGTGAGGSSVGEASKKRASADAVAEESSTAKKAKHKKRLTKQNIKELQKLQPGLVPKLVEICGAERLAYYVPSEDLAASSDGSSAVDQRPALSLKNIVKPRESDILCGGTNKQYDIHTGNANFRKVIDILRGVYQNARGKEERMKISGAVVASVRENQGRFIEKSAKASNWADIGDKKATKMIYDSFRKEESGPGVGEAATTTTMSAIPASKQAAAGPLSDPSQVAGFPGPHRPMIPGMAGAFGAGVGPPARSLLGMNYLAGAAMHLPHLRLGMGAVPPMIPSSNQIGNGMFKAPCKFLV